MLNEPFSILQRARPLKRLLQRSIADPLAIALLEGRYHEGDVVKVTVAHTEGDVAESAEGTERAEKLVLV